MHLMQGVGRGFLTRHKGRGPNPQGRDRHVAGIGGVLMVTAQDFLGQWTLERRIRDHLHGQHGTLEGQAEFTANDVAQLSYVETGRLMLANGAHMQASRRYLWAFTPEAVIVTFEDGRPFHQFVPAGHAAGTDHPCGDDFYTVRYDFTRWPAWTAVWTVTGPRKDYVSTSTYHRR